MTASENVYEFKMPVLHDIVLPNEQGDFELSDGSYGNPGCDECGMFDAAFKYNGSYYCDNAVVPQLPLLLRKAIRKHGDILTPCATITCENCNDKGWVLGEDPEEGVIEKPCSVCWNK